MEICAIATFWKSMGDNMGIDYHKLPRGEIGWKDGLEFYEDIKEWAEKYEVKYMLPVDSNRTTADQLGKYRVCLSWLDFHTTNLKL